MTLPADPRRFTPVERRSALSLGSIFALRMLGLFLILPVFAVYARHLPGGESAFAVGLTLGIYGLTQGILQIPFGAASDRWGRKPVIAAGLLIFAAGSILAALGSDIWTVMAGRALQGMGAVSAAVTAMISDSVRDRVLTKAMAIVGSSIGLTFAFSLVASPVLAHYIGVSGLFWLTAVLSLAAVWVTYRVVPDAPLVRKEAGTGSDWKATVFNPDLLRLNAGIFILHMAMMAVFVVIPVEMSRLDLPVSEHWKVYLPAVILSFGVLMPSISRAERAGKMKTLFLAAVLLLACVFAGFAAADDSLAAIGVLLFAFFCGFNILEATLPSFVSRTADASAKGLALGVYNTTQSIGLFVGGALGGWLSQTFGRTGVYAFCLVMTLVWFFIARGMTPPAAKAREPGEEIKI
ncbi:MAG: MFS transporter [Sutterella sp.]|uniref:MFS transporter n=1 Tax=Duodenibacillus massiliensis TaxID=1852381 RepID=UPI00093F4F4D|nr:MFS transporter [Duodenibacillus massiliensis]MBS5792593.1 MFS transporter [Sutterella sp.]